MESLLCYEEMPMYCPMSTQIQNHQSIPKHCFIASFSTSTTDENWEQSIRLYLEKERLYVPDSRYVDRVFSCSGLLCGRFRAVQWILKSCGRFDFGVATAFNAVNYLDRFVSVKLIHLDWENWMIELISIACLSIAAKTDEVFFPSLVEIQSEDLDHSFESKTIQRTEMAVLKALDWRLNPVTAHSYVEPLTWCRHAAIAARVTDLLLASLLDPMFLEFRPSVVAASALRCALEELTPSEYDVHVPALASLDSLERCHKAMEERLAPPEPPGCSHNPFCPSSPVTVIPSRRMEIIDQCINFDALFGVCNKKH